MQKVALVEHSESVITVLPIARLPVGGKHPSVLLHCALVAVGQEESKKKKMTRRFDRRVSCLVCFSLSR